MSKNYKVGKGRPPLHSRFKPGQSGNPKGRPKGIRRPQELVRKLLSRKVTIREAGSPRTATALEAMLLSLVARAMKGDHKAVSLLLGYLENLDDNSTAQRDIDSRAAAEAFTHHVLQLRQRKIQFSNEPPQK
jgi:hypothetical protein